MHFGADDGRAGRAGPQPAGGVSAESAAAVAAIAETHISVLIAVFHAAAATSEEIAAAGRRDAGQAIWEASFEQLAAFTGPVLDPDACGRVESLVRRYLAG